MPPSILRAPRRRPRRRTAAAALALLGALLATATEVPAQEADDGELPPRLTEREGHPGRFRRLREAPAPEDLTPEQQDQLERLRSIGYLGGVTESDRSGVTVHDPDRALDGLNLYTSGHDPAAYLMDMSGEVLHTWERAFADVWPDSPNARRWGARWWRRAHLYDNGDLLVIFEGIGIVRLDRDSNVVWASENGAHHDLEVLGDGDILVLTRTPRLIPAISATDLTLEDFLTRLDPGGAERWSVSVYDALASSPFAERIAQGRNPTGDVFHTNTLCVLDGTLADRVPAFRAGAVLTSLDALGLLAVWDPDEGTLTWGHELPPGGQHDPKLLANGHVLFFDNFRDGTSSVVTEMDPATGETVWEYRGTPDHPFHSRTCGTAERLGNGNTLITESDGGRAFEVTPGGEIVWEFYNPERAGDHEEYIATIGEMLRLPREAAASWLP